MATNGNGTSKPKPKSMPGDILSKAALLFAISGYDGVSMRDIARSVGMTPAALYHHFPDKEQLYICAVDCVFKEKTVGLRKVLAEGQPNWKKLEAFVFTFTDLLAKEKNFHRLLQWVLLDADENRMRKLASNVFYDIIREVHDLASNLDQDLDPNLVTMSITGLVMQPFELRRIHHVLPGFGPEHENPKVLAQHVVDLLRNGLSGAESTAPAKQARTRAVAQN